MKFNRSHLIKASSNTVSRNSFLNFFFFFHTKRDETPLFNFVSGYSSWADYLQSMSKDGTWGDHLVLLAAANCYQTPILVISSLGHEIAINPEHPVATLNSNPLLLGHVHEQHYVGLHPRKRKGFFLFPRCLPLNCFFAKAN